MPSEPFDRFVSELHAHRVADPNRRVALGIAEDLGALPDPSDAAVAAELAEARRLYEVAKGLDRGALTFDEALDADLAERMLEHEILAHTYTFNGRTARAQMPKAGDTLGDPLFMMLANDPRPPHAKLADIVARLEATPAYLEAELAKLDTPVARWVAMDVEKVSGLPSLFETVEALAAESEFPELARLRAARVKAEEALSGYAKALVAMEATPHFHLDDALARDIVRTRGIDVSLEDIHRFAVDFLADCKATLDALRPKLCTKYGLPEATTNAELHQALCARFAVDVPSGDLTAILRRYEAERDKVVAFCEDRDLFPIFEGQAMKVLQTPAFMAPSIPAGAMVEPPPFREGVRTSLIWLTLSEDLLDEHTELGIPGMIIHEGIPGHHLQLATAGIHPSVVRRHFTFMEQAEGWTTMLEDYMLDQGYMGELTDEARFIGKRDISRIGARVAIDLFFMTGDRKWLEVGVPFDRETDDPFKAAGSLLREVTGFVPGRVEAELNWYSQERGYPLSYLTGNRLVWALKADLAEHAERTDGLPTGLDLDRRFHAVFLQSGNMPLSFLRRVFQHEGLLPS